MKKIVLILLLINSFYVFGQDQNQITLSLGIGKNNMLQDESLSSTDIYGEQFNSIELRYVHNFVRRFNRRKVWAIETGVIFGLHEVVIQGNGLEVAKIEDIKIITVPTYIRYNFFKYFYVSGGPIFTLELNSEPVEFRSKQEGMGLGFGIGGEYHFAKHFLGFINPFLRQHNLIQFHETIFHDGLTEFGVKFGVAYEF